MVRAAGRRAASPILLLLLMAFAALAGTVRGGRTGLVGSHPSVGHNREVQAACAGACDILALPDPKEPASSSTNTGKAVSGILKGVFEVMKTFDQTKALVTLGTAVMYGIEGTKSEKNPEYETFKLQRDIKQSTDYLACKMDAMVKNLNVAADKRSSDEDLANFNSGLRAVISKYNQKCGEMNCLSVAHLPPSQRSKYRLDCAIDEGASPECPKTTTFNASRTCTYVLPGGEAKQGQCDPNGHCYDVYEYSNAIVAVQDAIKLFSSKDNLDDFHRFDKSTDTNAILALAKGSLVKILMLQQLIMLDGTGGTNGALTNFADEMADKLQARYDYLVDMDRLVSVVAALSRPSLALNDFHPDMVAWPYQRRADKSSCYNFKEGGWPVKCNYVKYLYSADAITLKAHIRKSCQTPAKVYESKCFVSPYLQECGRYSDGCSGDCGGVWDRCVSDKNQPSWSDFVGPYNELQKGKAKLNQERCPGVLPVVKAAIREQAASLQVDLKNELKDVKDIIATLRDIHRTGGMPRESFGILRKQYPRYAGACSSGGARPALRSQQASCGRNCASCQPSWRCLQCKPGFRLDANGSTCSK